MSGDASAGSAGLSSEQARRIVADTVLAHIASYRSDSGGPDGVEGLRGLMVALAQCLRRR